MYYLCHPFKNLFWEWLLRVGTVLERMSMEGHISNDVAGGWERRGGWGLGTLQSTALILTTPALLLSLASPPVPWRRKGLALICPFPEGYKKQVDLGFHESLPTLTYVEHFCCVLLLKMLFKWAGAHMPQEPKMWLGRLAQAMFL